MRQVLHAGWLTKSPPERKTHGPWRIFKSQWRKRYFVLSSIHASGILPGACPAQLEYFDNEKQTKRKGSINLNNCEQVVVHLESEYYRHVFIVKTTDRGHDRTYYLAADTETDMERWVGQLCSILNLKDEGPVPFAPNLTHSQSTIIPPRKYPVDRRPLKSTPGSSADSSSILSPVSECLDPFDSPPNSSSKLSGEDYFPLNECHSGETGGAQVLTPRAPQTSVRVVTIKGRNQTPQHSNLPEEYYNVSEDSNQDDVYNYPKGYTPRVVSDIYKLPPLQDGLNPQRDSDIYRVPPRDSTYDYPPPSQEWNRDSNYDYPPPVNGKRSEGLRDSTYDFPSSAVRGTYDGDSDGVQPLWECKSRHASEIVGDTYDILPQKSHDVDTSSFKAASNASFTLPSQGDVYDLPKVSRTSTPSVPPPKPHTMPQKLHRYVNAAPTPIGGNQRVPSQSRGPLDDSLYLEMNSAEANNVYIHMLQMGRAGSQSLESFQSTPPRRSSGVPHPSVPRGVSARDASPKAPGTLPRSQDRETGASNPVDEKMESFHDTPRTRSFRREPSNVVLPQKKCGASSSSSSSEDEDDDSLDSRSLQTISSVGLESPTSSQHPKPVVQYLDLDLNATAVAPPTSTSSSETQSKIEYNEIDMEKTTALFNAKLMLEKERKGSDKSET